MTRKTIHRLSEIPEGMTEAEEQRFWETHALGPELFLAGPEPEELTHLIPPRRTTRARLRMVRAYGPEGTILVSDSHGRRWFMTSPYRSLARTTQEMKKRPAPLKRPRPEFPGSSVDAGTAPPPRRRYA